MPFNTPPMNPPPEGEWMRRLRDGMQIWLVKQEEHARCVMPWAPPTPGHRCGRLVLDRYSGDRRWGTEAWYVGGRGEGLDNSQLILPCEGHLPEELAKATEERDIWIKSDIATLRREIRTITDLFNSISTRLIGLEQDATNRLIYLEEQVDWLSDQVDGTIARTPPPTERQPRGVRLRNREE